MQILFNKRNMNKKNLIENLILENYNQYYRLAYSYVHNDEDAYDIVQTGACKALKASNSLKNTEYAKTWIYRIMLNECFHHVKQPQSFSYEEIVEKGGMDLKYTEDHYSDLDLKAALDSLPDKDKAIVILKYFEDKTLEDIADILSLNINTVKSRLYRSMKKLRDSLSN